VFFIEFCAYFSRILCCKFAVAQLSLLPWPPIYLLDWGSTCML
jgi:hypothetical protein